MKSPFEDIDKAFLPFYTDAVAVKTADGRLTTLHVSVFQDATGDPLSEGAMETDRRDLAIVCLERDWPWVKRNVKRGDELTHAATGRRYKVSEVEDDFAVGKVIRAREA